MRIISIILLLLVVLSCRKEEQDTVVRPAPCVRYSMEDLADTVTEVINPGFGLWIFAVSGLSEYKVYIDDSLAVEWQVDGPEYDRRNEWCMVELKFIPDVPDTTYIKTIAKDRMGVVGGDTLRVIYDPEIFVPNLDLICWGPYMTYNSVSTGSNIYQTIKIGNNTWIARNLKENPISGNFQQVYPGHDSVYGYIYDWNAAMSLYVNASYQMPTKQEYENLVNQFGGTSTAGFKLKECGATHWKTFDMRVTSASGFTAIPGGSGNFTTLNLDAWYWTSTEYDSQNAYALHLTDNSGLAELVILPKTFLASVRQVLVSPPSVQQMLDAGQTPLAIYNMGYPTDSLFGKRYQGGYIFMFSELYGTGAVATNSYQYSVQWGCQGNILTQYGWGYGQQNTDAIIQYCGSVFSAAYYADALSQGGYDNWYLPSLDELTLIYSRLHQNNIGSYQAIKYWTSTSPLFYIPNSYMNAFAVDFSDGSVDTLDRSTGQKFIPVHSF